MHSMRTLLVAIAVSACAVMAHAETSTLASGDQIERGVTLSLPSEQPNEAQLTTTIQTELKRVGCFDGTADGLWDEKTKSALANFARRVKFDVPTTAASEQAVTLLQSRQERVCPLECGPGRIEQRGVCVAKAAPVAAPVPVKPQPRAEARQPPRGKGESESSGSGMCWHQNGRGTALVPCSETPTGRRAY